jgi:hypothetical protein
MACFVLDASSLKHYFFTLTYFVKDFASKRDVKRATCPHHLPHPVRARGRRFDINPSYFPDLTENELIGLYTYGMNVHYKYIYCRSAIELCLRGC